MARPKSEGAPPRAKGAISGLCSARAVTLRSIRLGEADKLITFYTPEYGKVKAIAKGALRIKSRIGGRVEPCALGRMVVFGKEGRAIAYLNSFDLIDSFSAIRSDLGAIARALAVVELIDKSQFESDPNEGIFDELVCALKIFATRSERARWDFALRAFQLRALSLSGYRPRMGVCVRCSKPLGNSHGKGIRFSARLGGALCGSHSDGELNRMDEMSLGVARLIETIIAAGPRILARLSAPEETLEKIGKITHDLTEFHLSESLRAEKFISDLKL